MLNKLKKWKEIGNVNIWGELGNIEHPDFNKKFLINLFEYIETEQDIAKSTLLYKKFLTEIGLFERSSNQIQYKDQQFFSITKVARNNWKTKTDYTTYAKHWMDLIFYYQNNKTEQTYTWSDYHKLKNINLNEYTKMENKGKYQFINIKYNISKIKEDIIKFCSVQNDELYKLEYNEYILKIKDNTTKKYKYDYYIFNSKLNTFTILTDKIKNTIITIFDYASIPMKLKENINIFYIDFLLNILLKSETILEYKKLVYNILVENTGQHIFYDYNECNLTSWISCLLKSMSDTETLIDSGEYYKNPEKLNKDKCRLVVIKEIDNISINKQIEDFKKLNISNIIIEKKDPIVKMYNIEYYTEIINKQSSQSTLINYINSSNNLNIKQFPTDCWKIFVCEDLLQTDFLIWCCSK